MRPEQEFRDFVAGFADPLARFAFLLSAGTELDSADITIAALASVRRQWDDVEATGAPEPLAMERLVSALPRSRRRVAAVVEALPGTDRGHVARPVAPAVPALGDLPDDEGDEGHAARGGVDGVEGVTSTSTGAVAARRSVGCGTALGGHRDPAVFAVGPTSIGRRWRCMAISAARDGGRSGAAALGRLD